MHNNKIGQTIPSYNCMRGSVTIIYNINGVEIEVERVFDKDGPNLTTTVLDYIYKKILGDINANGVKQEE